MKKYPLVVLLTFLILVYGLLFLSTMLAATDFPFVQKSIVDYGFALPQAWSFRGANGLGENFIFTLWSWPIDFTFGLLSRAGFPFLLLTKLIGVLPIVLIGFFSIKIFLEYFGIKGNSKYAGIALYLLNTYVLLLIDGGQLSVAFAYALFPAAFALFDRWIFNSLKSGLLPILAVVILGIFDIRFC